MSILKFHKIIREGEINFFLSNHITRRIISHGSHVAASLAATYASRLYRGLYRKTDYLFPTIRGINVDLGRPRRPLTKLNT